VKVEVTPKVLLELVKFAIENGRYEAALNLVNDALAQMPRDPEPPSPEGEAKP
jgi:Flp pilus assembly protein TadD